MTKKTWILAADRSGARLFEHTEPGTLALARQFDHPEGRLKNHEIDTDRGGSKADGAGQRNGTSHEVEATREEALAFARSLSAALTDARNQHAFDHLILMAEPRFLGILRAELDAPTTAMVTGSVHHELTHAPMDQVKQHLRELINV